ncbi:MAG: hypothetical protein ACK55I_09215, partial [bacterium]
MQSYLRTFCDELQKEFESKKSCATIKTTPKLDQVKAGYFWVHPPDATVDLAGEFGRTGKISPKPFYLPRIFVWLPELVPGFTHADHPGRIACPTCGGYETKVNGSGPKLSGHYCIFVVGTKNCEL